MQHIVRLLKRVLKAALFFTLFAFALNNQSDVTVQFFFGQAWTAPMVLVVLGAFACGLVVGVLGMMPRWWRQRAKTTDTAATNNTKASANASGPNNAAGVGALTAINAGSAASAVSGITDATQPIQRSTAARKATPEVPPHGI